jgi:serine O-acetyltransferase
LDRYFDAVLNETSFEAAMIRRVAARLSNDLVSLPLMVQAFRQRWQPTRPS